MRSSPRFLPVVFALATPWIVFACGLSPLTPPTGSSSSASSSGSGGAGGASVSSSSSNVSSSSSTVASSSGTGGQMGTGGATSSSGAGGAGGATSSSSSGGTGGDAPDAGDGSAPLVCNTTITKYAVDPSPHIAACFPVQYSSNPPTSGPHYPVWAAFKTYTTPVPRGFWVHDLEHGAVVISYNCPGGCDAELAQLQAFIDARPADPSCTPPVRSRIVVTPDPKLDVRFAASAWGWALRSGCFDLGLLGPFIDAHYGQGSEDSVLRRHGRDGARRGLPGRLRRGRRGAVIDQRRGPASPAPASAYMGRAPGMAVLGGARTAPASAGPTVGPASAAPASLRPTGPG
ncbi:MAG: DUF3105 domain-containing protein [Minicystis sp.]